MIDRGKEKSLEDDPAMAGDVEHLADVAKRNDRMPAAGPHARPHLTNPDATPGSGMLPAVGSEEDPNAAPTS